MAATLIAAALLAVGDRAARLPPSARDLGKAEGQCRTDEAGPAAIVTVIGLKDRRGLLRAELYPANDDDFLEDDTILVAAGKTFRRVERTLPASGPVQLCVRLPGPGTFTLSVLHDRDANLKFGLSSDGVGFPGNPRLGLGKPRAASASFTAGGGLTFLTVRLNYRRGLFGFGPLREP